MLKYPVQTSLEDKLKIVEKIKDNYLNQYRAHIIAIGVYGSIGKNIAGPYSDIEIHIVIEEEAIVAEYEFIYENIKIEIDVNTKSQLLKEAQTIDEMWPIVAGSYAEVLKIYDPTDFFSELKTTVLTYDEAKFTNAIRQFMIDELYETMGKIRNNWYNGNLNYLPQGAMDFAWEIAVLIGLVNKKYYTTRATTLQESLKMKYIPEHYHELVTLILEGDLQNKEKLYKYCESVWTAVNQWLTKRGIQYFVNELPC
ncbi:kanamycin nucleotidyltransferase C-terminal domain-containing protein [Bacillus kwashiorkori]|uniref:kanamycin nucleotidyltransferase C-terminal domain-containing protein n=1 Tax=Bacillus kwashiorkori TaxID=1522318 RepID=UPI00078369F8|nr:kanamycin nucleotidyltransferase C-terminal domain-containing protein [Bacillus kwashiorkori]